MTALTESVIKMFNGWANCEDNAAALVIEQPLKPITGQIVFPPTFAPAKKGASSDYIIDMIDGKGIVTLDTPGSHANRLEPIFLNPSYADLVPQIVISGGDNSTPFEKNILELGHRAADALVRSSEGAELLTEAFQKILKGDATALASIAPTSLVFGTWDSRGTGAKIPRSIEAVIRAEDVETLHRAAQYFASVKFDEIGLLPKESKSDKEKRSEAGFLDAPSGHKVGGVYVHGPIIRTVTINLVTISALGAGKDNEEKGKSLRQYILGLALVAATAPIPLYLRQGCFLVGNGTVHWQLVKNDGSTTTVDLNIENARAYACKSRDLFFKNPPESKTWKAKREFAERELKKRQHTTE
jgi:CRISPR-associated protein Csb1